VTADILERSCKHGAAGVKRVGAGWRLTAGSIKEGATVSTTGLRISSNPSSSRGIRWVRFRRLPNVFDVSDRSV
jgi:hypothetical protein